MARLGIVTACTIVAVAVAGPARAAEVTHVATAAEPDKPVDVDLSIRFDRQQKRVRITREMPDPGSSAFGSVIDQTMLRYTEVTNAIVPRVAIGLYNDVEIHAEWPYVLADDVSWRYGAIGGVSVDSPASPFYASSISQNTTSPSGTACRDIGGAPTTCAIFPVDTGRTVYHGGKMGDFKAGLTWGIFSDRRDDTKPFWLVGADITFPTADLYDPADGRGIAQANDWQSPYSVPAKRGTFGHKAWQFDLYTALSKRMGPIDPYFKVHATSMQKSASTYSNCQHAAEFQESGSNADTAQLASWAQARCVALGDSAGARLPFVTGIVFGTEIVPYEDPVENQKVTLDVRLTADYTSSSRWYNELTDATGKILWTEPYVSVGALVGLDLRFSNVVSLRGSAKLETQTPHFLTGEPLGANVDYTNAANASQLNPNFDARYDLPGKRFRATETSVFTVNVAFLLQF